MKQLSWSEQKLNALSVRRVVVLYFRFYFTGFFTQVDQYICEYEALEHDKAERILQLQQEKDERIRAVEKEKAEGMRSLEAARVALINRKSKEARRQVRFISYYFLLMVMLCVLILRALVMNHSRIECTQKPSQIL